MFCLVKKLLKLFLLIQFNFYNLPFLFQILWIMHKVCIKKFFNFITTITIHDISRFQWHIKAEQLFAKIWQNFGLGHCHVFNFLFSLFNSQNLAGTMNDIFHDFSWPVLKFYDFPAGLENVFLKFHSFPCFP